MFPEWTKYISDDRGRFTLQMPNDLQEVSAEPNRLQTLKLLQYYRDEYQSLQTGD